MYKACADPLQMPKYAAKMTGIARQLKRYEEREKTLIERFNQAFEGLDAPTYKLHLTEKFGLRDAGAVRGEGTWPKEEDLQKI